MGNLAKTKTFSMAEKYNLRGGVTFISKHFYTVGEINWVMQVSLQKETLVAKEGRQVYQGRNSPRDSTTAKVSLASLS